MASYRSSIKLHSADRKQQWRDKFKSHCAERMKLARQEQLDQRRHDSWINSIVAQEWQQFRKEHEAELEQAGVDLYADLENMIDYNQRGTTMEGPERALYEEHERLQQEELDTAIETYEAMSQLASICIKCQHSTFIYHNNIHQCTTCGFSMKKELMDAVNLTIQNHASVCSSHVEFTVEPGVDGSIIGLCSGCDLWMLV